MKAGYMHIASFSFQPEAGLTGNVEISKSETLLPMMLAAGFSTSYEPLMIRFPHAAAGMQQYLVILMCFRLMPPHPAPSKVSEQAASDEVITTGSILLLKGHARTMTVLALLAFIMKRGQSVKAVSWHSSWQL